MAKKNGEIEGKSVGDWFRILFASLRGNGDKVKMAGEKRKANAEVVGGRPDRTN